MSVNSVSGPSQMPVMPVEAKRAQLQALLLKKSVEAQTQAIAAQEPESPGLSKGRLIDVRV